MAKKRTAKKSIPPVATSKKRALLKTAQREFLNKLGDLSSAGFGVVAALAWNDAIKAWVTQVLKPGNGITALFLYALIVTVIAVLVTVVIGRAIAKLVPKDEVKE